MTAVWRLARGLTSRRTIASAKTLNPRPSLSPLPLSAAPLCNRSFEQQKPYGSDSWGPKGLPNFFVHTALAGLLGFGTLDVAFADDGNEAAAKSPPLPESAEIPPPLQSSPVSSQNNLDEIARKEKARLIELLKSKGGRTGSYPQFTVSVKGQKVSIKFQVPPSAEIPFLIANLVSRLGVKPKDNGVGSDMMLRAWDSGVAWQLAFNRPKTPKGASEDQGDAKDKNVDNEEFCILMFRPLISSDKAEIEFMKQGSFTSEELDALASILKLAGQPKSVALGQRGGPAEVPAADKTVSNLEGMGVKIYGLKPSNLDDPNVNISWDNIAGYDNQKRQPKRTLALFSYFLSSFMASSFMKG